MSALVAEDRPTIGERYGVAIGASNLRVGERHGGADMVLAAGMVGAAATRHGLSFGALLFRLQAEYDTVRGDLEHAGEISRRGGLEAGRVARSTHRLDGSERPDGEGAMLAEAIRQRTEAEVLTARCLILIHLKTLDRAKQAVAVHALKIAKKHRFAERPEVIAKLVGRVIDVWLDPTCHKCDGTGWVSSGYQGEATKACDACSGTGHRRERMGNSDASRWFSFILLGDIQREMAAAAGAMGRLLRCA